MTDIPHISHVNGELRIHGDKSICHRALIFSAMADGVSFISGIGQGSDIHSTVRCLAAMGAEVHVNGSMAKVFGVGYKKFRAPVNPLNAGNSGTTARLLLGLCAPQPFSCSITGDVSLSNRPMKRIIEPLSLMGARIESSSRNTLPAYISPAPLKAVQYTMPIASAQVKSGIILAALHLDEETKIYERSITRNHTELMLNLPVVTSGPFRVITCSRYNYPHAIEFALPADISSAAFFITLASLLPNSKLLVKNISMNNTRTEFLKILFRMGARIINENLRYVNGEPVGDIYVESGELKNVDIRLDEIAGIIDEIPILAVAGYFAEGIFTIRGAHELRLKESDRITTLVQNFKSVGAEIEEFPDGFSIIKKPVPQTAHFESFGDHRIAMAFAIFSAILKNGGIISNFECVNISYPNFFDHLTQIGE